MRENKQSLQMIVSIFCLILFINQSNQQTKEDFDNRKIPERFIACNLKGVEEAMCVPRSSIKSETPFCNSYIYDHVCVPVYHYLWSNWTLNAKDFQVEEQVILNTENRLLLELAQPLNQTGIMNLEVTTTKSCLESYKQFTCRYNFPLCDGETGETFKICQTECIIISLFNNSFKGSTFYGNCGLDVAGCNLKNWDFMDSDTRSCGYI
eukprot:403339592